MNDILDDAESVDISLLKRMCKDYLQELKEAKVYPMRILKASVGVLSWIIDAGYLKVFMETEEFWDFVKVLAENFDKNISNWPVKREVTDNDRDVTDFFKKSFNEISKKLHDDCVSNPHLSSDVSPKSCRLDILSPKK